MSTSSSSPSRPVHSSSIFYMKNIIGLTIYTAILSRLLNAEQYRMYKLFTFIVITPIVKYLRVYPQARTNSRIMSTFLLSIISDTCTAILVCYIVPTYMRGPIYAIYPLCVTFTGLGFEALQYRLFDYNQPGSDNKYLIKLAPNPLDNSLVIMVCFVYYIQSQYIQWDSNISWYLLLTWLILQHIFDFSFGVLHHYSHTVPAIWKKHKLHHVYKRSELTSFANFYADFIDSWMMNIGFFLSSAAVVFLGGDSFYWNLDIMTTAVMTHNKYTSDHYSLYYLWEYDALCQWFNHQRIAEYHNQHHYDQTHGFGALGFLSDDLFQKIAPDLKPHFPALWKVDSDTEKDMDKQQ